MQFTRLIIDSDDLRVDDDRGDRRVPLKCEAEQVDDIRVLRRVQFSWEVFKE